MHKIAVSEHLNFRMNLRGESSGLIKKCSRTAPNGLQIPNGIQCTEPDLRSSKATPHNADCMEARSLVLFHCYPGPHYLLREPDLPLLWCLPPSCPDRKSNTLHLHSKLSKNQAILTSLNFWITHLWTSQCLRGKALLLARGFLGDVGVLAQITVQFVFPPFAGCLLSPKRTCTESDVVGESIKHDLLHSRTHLGSRNWAAYLDLVHYEHALNWHWRKTDSRI